VDFTWKNVAHGGQVVAYLPLDPRAEDSGFLRVMKIHSMTSCGGEVKPSAPCHNILQHVKEPCKYERDPRRQNSLAISLPSFPALLLDALLVIIGELWWKNQKWLENQMGMYNRSEVVVV
jgi:hypothetical protein